LALERAIEPVTAREARRPEDSGAELRRDAFFFARFAGFFFAGARFAGAFLVVFFFVDLAAAEERDLVAVLRVAVVLPVFRPLEVRLAAIIISE
jgi:hypothetical protein